MDKMKIEIIIFISYKIYLVYITMFANEKL